MKIHHTAVVVSDLERSIEFYERYFGGTVERVIGDVDDPAIAELHELPEVRFTLAFVGFENTRLELFRFAVPGDGRRLGARACDFGTTHVAFEVDDLHTEYERLVAAGVRFTRPPHTLPDGLVLAFCSDPDGNRIELMQHP